MKKTAIVVLACALLLVPGCSLVDGLFGEPTIKSPYSGQPVTGSELVAERDKAAAEAKARLATLRAKFQSALVRAKNDADTALAELKAEYEPQLESVDAELALVASNFTLGADAISAKFERQEGFWSQVGGVLQSAGVAFPQASGALAVGGLAFGALGSLFGLRKASAAKQATKTATTLRGHLENVVDALDHVEAGTAMVERDTEYRDWLGAATAAAIDAISKRHEPRVDPAVTGKAS